MTPVGNNAFHGPKRVVLHVLVWVCYILYESSLLLIVDGVHLNVWEISLNFSLYAAVFYLHSEVILPGVFIKKRPLVGLGSVLVLGGCVALRYVLYRYVIPHLDPAMLHPFSGGKLFLAQSIWRSGYYTLLGVGYFFAVYSIRTEREKRKMAEARVEQESQLREMEKTLLEAEILNLKSQINPHFLYNALNFFYSQVYPYSQKAANGILLLADMMRYALKEDDINGKVMLEEEVKHLQNYIGMNQLRFDDRLQVRFEIAGSVRFRLIMPLILITFVENCFKHGELFDPVCPVLIKLEVSNEQLIFLTRNKKISGTKPKSTGVGIKNIRRRLELGYASRYSLHMEDDIDFYSCTLTLNL
jgi:hypothetical protein